MPTITPCQANQPLILVDGFSYLYRAFYALPALTNAAGVPTGAIYGMVNMLHKLITDYQPKLMAVVCDSPGQTIRHHLYPEYKANRAAMPEALAQQIAPLYHIIAALGVTIISVPGIEADDIIATLATIAAQSGKNVLIASGDKDLAQLVNNQITLINTMTDEHLTVEAIYQKFAVYPEQISDYLALVGDKSDNIPGVPMVGRKTAAKLLQHYGSLANILAQSANINGKLGTAIRAATTQILLAKDLVTVKCDLSLPWHWSELQVKNYNYAALNDWAIKLNFKRWSSTLLAHYNSEIPAENYPYELITQQQQLDVWWQQTATTTYVAVNLLSDTSIAGSPQLLGIAMAGKSNIYLPIKQLAMTQQDLSAKLVVDMLPLCLSTTPLKVWHNMKGQLAILLAQQPPSSAANKLAGNFDIMLAAYVLDSSSVNYELTSLIAKYLPESLSVAQSMLKHSNKATDFLAPEALPQAAATMVNTAMLIKQLYTPISAAIAKDPGLHFIFTAIEMPLVPVLVAMEQHGVLIDVSNLQQQTAELSTRLHEIEQEAYQIAGQKFNLNSPQQIQQLFMALNMPLLRKTPKGKPSTADDVLQELALDYPLPALIIEHRSLSKLIFTYTQKLPQQINARTGRIHTSYNQTATVTGRLSSSEPNLQNIPIRTTLGKRIRQAFIAPPGYQIVTADYSQIELRLMAHIAQDKNLLLAFEQGLDIHQATAAEVLNIAITEVNNSQRRQAKAINFGLLYGMSAFGLARQLKITQQAAQQYIDCYFARYPQVRVYMDTARYNAHNDGYVTTLWGRRLYLPGIKSAKLSQQKTAERAAINAPLQGSAADIIKMAMIRLHQVLVPYDAVMIMQVHDELVFEVETSCVAAVKTVIAAAMCEVASLSVPLTVVIGSGANWDLAHSHAQ